MSDFAAALPNKLAPHYDITETKKQCGRQTPDEAAIALTKVAHWLNIKDCEVPMMEIFETARALESELYKEESCVDEQDVVSYKY